MTKAEMATEIKVMKRRMDRMELESEDREAKLVKAMLLVGQFMPIIEKYCPDEIQTVLDRFNETRKPEDKI